MVIYSRHAKIQMKFRRISKDEVEYCLNNHTLDYTDKKGNPIYVAKTPSGRRIKVVVEKSSNPIKVITAAD